MSFKREKLNPIDLISQFWPNADHSHLTYDSSLKMRGGQFDIIRYCGGDGTLAFTIDMLQDVLVNPMNMASHCKSDNVDFDKIKKINYTIGPVYHSTVYGSIELKCGGKYTGQRERARMPVICNYIYK